ncbi:MAG: sulfur carrier protein ThiS [Pseudomonadota bacterium]
MASIILNGKEHAFRTEMTVAELLESLGTPKEGTAIAVNSNIVPREGQANFKIKEGDAVEIIRAIGGG